nr:hypothetical protein BaRGS_017371 [Batillaria attramentaria]
MCTFNAIDCEKARPQTEQEKGLSPVCVRKCVLRLHAKEKANGQCGHLLTGLSFFPPAPKGMLADTVVMMSDASELFSEAGKLTEVGFKPSEGWLHLEQ